MKKVVNYILILMVLIMPFSVYAKDVETKKVTLEKCVDGDTATFKDESGNTFKTRFLAIDTPESVHPTKEVQAYGKDASEYTCDKLTNAKEIILETDEKSNKEDKYGRYLAWVFVDGELLQNELIKEGLAKVAYLYSDYKYADTLKSIELVAKEEKKGIWAEDTTENDEKDDAKKEKENKKDNTKKKSKSIFDLIADFFNSIIDCILDFIDSIASWIDSML